MKINDEVEFNGEMDAMLAEMFTLIKPNGVPTSIARLFTENRLIISSKPLPNHITFIDDSYGYPYPAKYFTPVQEKQKLHINEKYEATINMVEKEARKLFTNKKWATLVSSNEDPKQEAPLFISIANNKTNKMLVYRFFETITLHDVLTLLHEAKQRLDGKND